ncbi:hypothetical protein TNCV_2687871 [Trichonephila clavipes]|nr:hypothetical protein TNCV_2687871 [Trichonephila clavipes]
MAICTLGRTAIRTLERMAICRMLRPALVLILHRKDLRTQVKNIQFELPPQSPDLNPVEHLWNIVERVFRYPDTQSSNPTLLESAIHEAWSHILQTTGQHLTESILKRIKSTSKTKYNLMSN